MLSSLCSGLVARRFIVCASDGISRVRPSEYAFRGCEVVYGPYSAFGCGVCGWWHVPVLTLACFWGARRGVGTFRAGEYSECALLAFCSTCVLSRVWFGARGRVEDGVGEA